MAAAPPAHVDETMEEAVVSDDVKVAATELDGNGNGNGHTVVALADVQEQLPADDSTGSFSQKFLKFFRFRLVALGTYILFPPMNFFFRARSLNYFMRKTSRI